MGYWKKEFDKIAKKAIRTYSVQYGSAEEKTAIRIVFDTAGELAFFTQIGMNLKEQVRFLHVLHGPKAKLDLTGKSLLIPRIVRKVLERTAQAHGVDKQQMALVIRKQADDIYVFMASPDNKNIKLLTADELFDDEQIMADQIQEAQ